MPGSLKGCTPGCVVRAYVCVRMRRWNRNGEDALPAIGSAERRLQQRQRWREKASPAEEKSMGEEIFFWSRHRGRCNPAFDSIKAMARCAKALLRVRVR